MGKQTVLASLVDVWARSSGSTERAIVQSVGWIDASSVYGDSIKFDLFMNTVTQAHSGTRTGAPLFEAINNIHTNNTKWTTISIESTGGDSNSGKTAYILIEIDWEALRVKWSGGLFMAVPSNPRSTRNCIFQGDESIDALGSRIEMQSWSRDSRVTRGNPIGYSPFVYLQTGPGRKLVQLPLFILSGSTGSFGGAAFGRNISTYAITTDDGIIATATPTPPAETPTETVSGIKISELNAATSLNNDDLFVLSRDDPAGAPYDKSLNITKTKLIESITPEMPAPVFLETKKEILNASNVPTAEEVDLTEAANGGIPQNSKSAILEAYWDVSGPDGGGSVYLYMGPDATTSLVLANIRAAGAGDAISACNQGICPIADGKIYFKTSGSFVGGVVVVNIIGYYT